MDSEDLWNTIPEENRFEINAAGPGECSESFAALLAEPQKVIALRIYTRSKSRGMLPDLSALTKLKALDLRWCKCTSLPELSALTALRWLNLFGAYHLDSLPDLSGLRELRFLNLSCESLRSVPDLSALTKLRSLVLVGCKSLHEFPDLSCLTSLESLNLSWPEAQHNLPELSALTNLQSLKLRFWTWLESIPCLSALTQLKSLTLNGCESLRSLPDLSSLRNLQELDLGGCSSLASIPGLSALTNLHSLNLGFCDALQDIPNLAPLTNLRSLILSGSACNNPQPSLSSLTQLETLGLRTGEGVLADLSFLGAANPKSLDLGYCANLRSLPDLSGLSNLESLDLRSCKSLQSLPDLSALNKLESLNLEFCEALKSLPDLSALTNLRSLKLQFCTSLQSLPDLSSLSSLQSLSLSDSASLQAIPGLSKLLNLRSLSLVGLPLIKELRHLAETSLTDFYHDDPELVAWILAQTRPRVSAACFFQDFEDWCSLISNAKNPGDLIRVIALGFAQSRRTEEPDGALPRLIAATLSVESGMLQPSAWNALLACVDLGASRHRDEIENLLEIIKPKRLLTECLRPSLNILSQATSEQRPWAVSLVEQILAKHPLASLRFLAPEICLFFRRHREQERFRNWLNAFTDLRAQESLMHSNSSPNGDCRLSVNEQDLQGYATSVREHCGQLRDHLRQVLVKDLANENYSS